MSAAFDAACKVYVSGVDVGLNDFDSLPLVTNPIDAEGSAVVSGNLVTVMGSVSSWTAIVYDDLGNLVSPQTEENATVQLTLEFPASLNATSFTVNVVGRTSTSTTASMSNFPQIKNNYLPPSM